MKPAAILVATLLSILGEAYLAESSPRLEVPGCKILINGGLAEPQPLVLRPGNGSGFAIPQETTTGRIDLATAESLRLVCLGEDNWLEIDTEEPVSEAIVTCLTGTRFYVDGLGIIEKFEDIACTKYPKHTARRTGRPCAFGELCEIGFDLGGGDFQTLITLCHDDANHTTHYAYGQIPAVIDAWQRSFPPPNFIEGDFFDDISMASVYTKANQRVTLAKILGSEDLALEYLPTTGIHFFSRAHLAAKADFIYGSQQRAAYYYLNVVPVWQIINSGNWETLEMNLRALATDRNIGIDVWTGAMGVLTLDDVNGVKQEVHLYVDDNDNRAVPAPKILFKVVREKTSGQGVVFIVANNPYLETLTSDYVICDDICDSLTYLTWKSTVGSKGLAYCCEVDDFRRAFPGIPTFATTDLLK